MNLEQIYNPYDFANPVVKHDLFAGRKDELTEINYYLDYAKQVNKPISLAVIGRRASGKTSLLNIIQSEAETKDFCVVRIDLDEGDAQSQLAFFYKLFDCVLSSACGLEAFGGVQARTYQTYLEMACSYEIPEDKTYCSFLFPFQYAYAMRQNNQSTQLSDHNFKKDLQLIYQSIKRPIIILFDESNVLTANRILLEKLRNIFMNLEGYMLVLTGTPELFPIMDDVFSPLVRQFKKINLIGFQTIEDTADCITKPLDKIGVPHPYLMDDNLIKEIHQLAGGRPYEIQLICHFLFRQVQQKQAKAMKLNIRALEQIRNELLRSSDLQGRPILNTIRNLKVADYLAISILCCCDGQASFEEMWKIEYIFNGRKNWTEKSLRSKLDQLITIGTLKEENNIIKFCGDDFDKLYLKYSARERDIFINFIDGPLELYWAIRLKSNLYKFNYLKIPIAFKISESAENISLLVNKLSDSSQTGDVFSEGNPLYESFYKLFLNYYWVDSISLLTISLNSQRINIHMWYSLEPGCKDYSLCVNYLEYLANQVKQTGGCLSTKIDIIKIANSDILRKRVKNSSNEELKLRLSNYHLEKLFRVYTEEVDLSKALFHANLAYEYNPNIKEAMAINNIGYLFLKNKQIKEAKELLTQTLIYENYTYDKALPLYNLGIAELLDGDIPKALENFRKCLNCLTKIDEIKHVCACLLVPVWDNGKILTQEDNCSPELQACAIEAIALLDSLLENNSTALIVSVK